MAQVVEQEGRYWSEADAKYVDRAVNRYILNVRVMDCTGDSYVTLFNEQVRIVRSFTVLCLSSIPCMGSGPRRYVHEAIG